MARKRFMDRFLEEMDGGMLESDPDDPWSHSGSGSNRKNLKPGKPYKAPPGRYKAGGSRPSPLFSAALNSFDKLKANISAAESKLLKSGPARSSDVKAAEQQIAMLRREADATLRALKDARRQMDSGPEDY